MIPPELAARLPASTVQMCRQGTVLNLHAIVSAISVPFLGLPDTPGDRRKNGASKFRRVPALFLFVQILAVIAVT
jgi:hypothetical protein